MYFDIDDRHPDTERLESAMSWRDGLSLSLLIHILLVLAVVFLPSLLPVSRPNARDLEQQMAEARAREANARRFVFVQPRAEFEAKRPPIAPQLSDRDRTAQAPERAPNPTNPMPFSRGNTSELTDVPGTRAQPPQPQPPAPPESGQDRSAGGASGPQGSNDGGSFLRGLTGPSARSKDGSGGASSGEGLGDALRNVQRYYAPEQVFDNQQGGGGDFGSAIQFDTKGVEFGPWVRRFIAQIKRNWFIPYAAMSLRGRVVMTFNVHKDGRITDVTVVGPSGIDAFDNSSFNAVAASNPTQALPPEYPSDHAFFTVTFYYNETPPR
jgi:TonB family protein